jgi:tRNA-dihydrouridine synthase B
LISEKMKLGHLQLSGNLFLAPLSGITDYPFRQIARERGCGLAFTGLMNAEGLLRKRGMYLRIERDDHPLSVQLFGSDPEVLAEAAQWVEEKGADALDINMGCPSTQVVEEGAGVALMQFPEKVKEILIRKREERNRPEKSHLHPFLSCQFNRCFRNPCHTPEAATIN